MSAPAETLANLRSKPAQSLEPVRSMSMAQIHQLPQEKQFGAMLNSFKDQITLALPQHITADRMARLALTAFKSNRDLARCDPGSIFASVILAAQLGLEIGVDGQGYLVPYKGKATFVPGWKGYVELINRAGRATVWTGAVFLGDDFEYQLGDDPFCRHRPTGKSDETKANLAYTYAIGRIHGSDYPVIEVWPLAKVIRHLAKFNKVGGRHYALANEHNFIQYGRKVALMQVMKYMPKSVELRAAQAAEAGAELDLRSVLDGDFTNIDTTPYDEGAGSAGDTGGDDPRDEVTLADPKTTTESAAGATPAATESAATAGGETPPPDATPSGAGEAPAGRGRAPRARLDLE